MMPELVIVGAGPAGVSAALWARTLELSVELIESAPLPGGQLHAVHFHPVDVAGIEAGEGPDIAASYARQLAGVGVRMRAESAATSLEPGTADGPPAVRLSTGERIEAAALLVATGVRKRHLGLPGERALEGHGVSYSATRDLRELAGRRVAVVGGGDAALENALLLASAGCDVTLLARGTARARPEFRARVAAEPRIRLHEGARVVALLGRPELRALRVHTSAGEWELACEAVVIKVGVLPNTEWCVASVAADRDGFLVVDAELQTSVARVWAAGDCARPLLPSIPVAMAQGAQVASLVRASLHGR